MTAAIVPAAALVRQPQERLRRTAQNVARYAPLDDARRARYVRDMVEDLHAMAGLDVPARRLEPDPETGVS